MGSLEYNSVVTQVRILVTALGIVLKNNLTRSPRVDDTNIGGFGFLDIYNRRKMGVGENQIVL